MKEERDKKETKTEIKRQKPDSGFKMALNLPITTLDARTEEQSFRNSEG